MDGPRTLPPLVRGKLTGILDFYVDEVRIFRNILLLTDDCDVVVQVQWWGEGIPAYIRPQKINREHNRKCKFLNGCCHSNKYEVRTKVDLFKSYLQACEVLELGVLEIFENLVIGSAFLKDLVWVLSQNDRPITIPLIDHAGDEIGDITIHLILSSGFFIKEEEKPTMHVISLLPNHNPSHSLPNKSNSSKYSSDSRLSIINETVKKFAQPQNSKEVPVKQKPIVKPLLHLPEVEILTDSSKVINYKSKTRQSKNLKSTMVNKKPKTQTKNSKPKIIQKRPESHPKIDSVKLPLPNKPNEIHSPVRKTSDENIKKVMHYLLGSEMRKEDEESALNDLIKLSPSHDLVSGISQLCTESALSSCNPSLADDRLKMNYVKVNNLDFDLSNPIERNYYEKFFVNCNKSNDFELAEVLNKPMNRICLSEDVSSSLRAKESPETDKNIGELLEKIKVTSSCPQCKYYKKLGELDTIIESLKHFEQKMLRGNGKDQANIGCF